VPEPEAATLLAKSAAAPQRIWRWRIRPGGSPLFSLNKQCPAAGPCALIPAGHLDRALQDVERHLHSLETIAADGQAIPPRGGAKRGISASSRGACAAGRPSGRSESVRRGPPVKLHMATGAHVIAANGCGHLLPWQGAGGARFPTRSLPHAPT